MTDWARNIRQGDARALARAATGIENRDAAAQAVLRELEPFSGHARLVGITGPPGAGKSTLVDALAAAIRKRNQTAAIIAVDPTSRLTGGAILGDRIRMQQHHADPGIFIRSMATRGTAGGLAEATRDLARLMDAAGKDYVLIETVGVGQDEVQIAELAQVTVVVLVPGMGDDVQTMKAGILEIADIFVVNKADLPEADRVEQELEAMLQLGDGAKPPVIRTVARAGAGVDELLAAIDDRSLRVAVLKAPSAQGPSLPNMGLSQNREHPSPTRDSLPSRDRKGAEVLGAEVLGAEVLGAEVPHADVPSAIVTLRVTDADAAVATLRAAGLLVELIEERK